MNHRRLFIGNSCRNGAIRRVRLLRFTASDIYRRPESVIALVRGHVHESVHTTMTPAA